MRTILDLPPGIIGDDTDFSTPGYTDCSGGRFWRGRFQTTGGWERLSLTDLTGVCRGVFGFNNPDGIQTFAFGLHNGLTVWQGGDQASITPSGFVAGQIDGTTGPGYGAGAYGAGEYGEPSTDSYYPGTWSFGVRYGILYANFRGQGINVWDNDTGSLATVLTNAPAVCTFLLSVWTGQLMAFGCTNVGGNYEATLVRTSDTRDPENWAAGDSASNAQEFAIEGNGRIVGARAIGQSVYVWTESELHVGSWDSTSWSFTRIGVGGLCGPNAAIVSGQTAYWIGQDLQFYFCSLGGAPQILPCPIRTDFSENAALGQNSKIIAATVSEFGEVVWFYADSRDGYENSRALRFSTVDGAWAKDQLARTAFIDANPAVSPVGVTYDGKIYWHERGNAADGSPLEWFLETGDQYLDPGERHVMLREWRPDLRGPDGGYQLGAVTLTITTQRYPQDETVTGTYMASAGQAKVDLRQSGMLARFRFSGSSLPSFARFGKQTLDFALAGER